MVLLEILGFIFVLIIVAVIAVVILGYIFFKQQISEIFDGIEGFGVNSKHKNLFWILFNKFVFLIISLMIKLFWTENQNFWLYYRIVLKFGLDF